MKKTTGVLMLIVFVIGLYTAIALTIGWLIALAIFMGAIFLTWFLVTAINLMQ